MRPDLSKVLFTTCALLCLASGTAIAQDSKARTNKPERLWTREQTELESPSFNRSGTEVVFTRKLHELDGAEAEMSSPADMKELDRKKDSNHRWADPQISILKLSDKSLETVGYGWQGVFSADGEKVFFDHQLKPISGFRRLAESEVGNDLRSFDRNSKKTEVVATPPANMFLGTPSLSPDGSRLSYTVNDAINGSWGGSVGAGIVDLKSSKPKIVFKPSKAHDLYVLVDPILWASNKLVAVEDVPADEGSYMADHYRTQVLNESGKILYKTPVHKVDDSNKLECSPGEAGRLVVFPNAKTKLADVIDSATGAKQKLALPHGTISPDGKMSVRIEKRKLILTTTRSPGKSPAKASRIITCNGFVQSISWSADSRQLVYIVDLTADPETTIGFTGQELWRIKL